jgi:hypothetical protein
VDAVVRVRYFVTVTAEANTRRLRSACVPSFLANLLSVVEAASFLSCFSVFAVANFEFSFAREVDVEAGRSSTELDLGLVFLAVGGTFVDLETKGGTCVDLETYTPVSKPYQCKSVKSVH